MSARAPGTARERPALERGTSHLRCTGQGWNLQATIYIYIYIYASMDTHTHTHTHIYIYIYIYKRTWKRARAPSA